MTGTRTRASRLLALLLASLLLCLGGCGRGESPPEETPAPEEPAVTLEPGLTRPAWDSVPVYYDGLLADRAYCREGTVFLDPAPLCGILGLPQENDSRDGGVTLRLGGLPVSGEAGQQYLRAGERYLYTPEGWISLYGRVYLPADAVGRLFCVEIRLAEDQSRVDLSTSGIRLMDGSKAYYQERCADEDLFWLTHIINAEAKDQPLAGQIGVGNVVLNRVADKRYPDTIQGVIFQRGEERAQFDPVDDGGIHMAPDEISLVAAYLCLEGYNTVGPSEFFVNPDRGNATWFEAYRTFIIRIGDHDFYA